MTNCENCKFGRKPQKTIKEPVKPIAVKRKFLFWSYMHEPDEWDVWGYAILKDNYDIWLNRIWCYLNPKTTEKTKTSWCSHFEPKENDD